MINARMRNYNYYTLGNNDEYGQPQEVKADDTIKMAINFVTETIQENPLYSGAQYTGLTLNKNIDATYIIQYGDERLKVLFVNKTGRYKQAFMARI
jgi:hypothetical protein